MRMNERTCHLFYNTIIESMLKYNNKVSSSIVAYYKYHKYVLGSP